MTTTRGHMLLRAVLLTWLALGLVLTPLTAWAQGAGRLSLLGLDLSRFPQVSFLMEAYNASGQFIPNLTSDQIRIIEDGAARPVLSFERQRSGLHLVVAVNSAPALGFSVGGSPLLEQVRTALLAWSARQLPGLDEFSLVSNSGGQSTKLSDPAQWGEALRGFAPDLQRGQPSVSSLTQAFDLVTDAGRRTSARRAVLWVTPPLPESALPALPNLADRASQLGAHLFVWLVMPPGSADLRSQAALTDLAARTGGQFALFTGGQSTPDLESWLSALRFIYQVEYASAARTSGGHRLAVQLNPDEINPASAELRFSLALEAPNPIFLSPPVKVQRTWIESAGAAQPVLQPEQVELPLLLEFPDGIRRALTETRLYVDGALVNRTSSPAPVGIAWLLEGFSVSGRHTLRVEVEDVLGYRRSSIETPVELEVAPQPTPKRTAGALLAPDVWVSALLGGGLTLALGGLVLAWTLRRKKGSAKRAAPAWHKPRLSNAQPASRLRLPVQDAPARLVRVTEDGLELPANNIPLPRQEVTLGSEPRKAAVVVESSSMSPLHARIQPQGETDYLLKDAGSVAGTWVNDQCVPAEGVLLQHGDWVHFGREAYRFELQHPRQMTEIVIHRLEEQP